MLSIHVVSSGSEETHKHEGGVLELGRGPQRQARRIVVKDPSVSRDQLQLEELPGGRLRLVNLSQSQPVKIPGGPTIAIGGNRELDLPVTLSLGQTLVDVEVGRADADDTPPPAAGAHGDTKIDQELYKTVSEPARATAPAKKKPILKALNDSPSPEKIAHWLESVLGLQRSPADSKEFYSQTARALVELVDLQLGMVILRRNDKWDIAGYYTTSDTISSRYSRTLLNHVVKERRTFYQDSDNMKIEAASLVNVEAVVVSPIFGLGEEVAGVLYGSRTWGGLGRGKIHAMEAQVVQLLAAGVSENLTRTVATKTRAQFEQFFSPELVRELERNPALLEGRDQEVTILVSDLRGLGEIAERLGPETTCQVVRDVMERLTERIIAESGVIVDYAGDGILAMWNAPVPQKDHADRACRAALAMLAELPGLNSRWRETVGGPLSYGIGINTGSAQVGNTGSRRKLKYGPHGLTVNLASRVQDATKRVGVPILISPSVRERLPEDGFLTREVGKVEMKGITGGVMLHELCQQEATLVR
jgi:adenylate cyclase